MKKIRPEVTTVTSKSHFRTWKSGKSWLFATSALAIIIVSGTITDQNVKRTQQLIVVSKLVVLLR